MANDSNSQQCLADDVTFRRRLKDAFSTVAWEVIEEPDTTPNHEARERYARGVVLPNLDLVVSQNVAWLVNRGNIFGPVTSFDFASRTTVTAATDAEIRSQVHSDWDIMAGVGL